MITPTVGRVVWIRNRGTTATQPEVALICYVHSDTLINAVGWDCNGEQFKLSSLPLESGDAATDAWIVEGSPFAEWMPYQKGQQAAKTEALESRLGQAAGAAGGTSGSAG